MAKSKIGAIIALDGDKEFRQSVTDCNKSIKTLKSEMSLANAEYEGNANTLEALSKKHEILTLTLEEQKRKEEAISKGLEHAREAYEKVGDGLVTLNKKLEEAQESLEDMGNSSDTTKEQLEEQKKTVQELQEAISKGEANYQRAANKIKDWETQLNTAKAQTIKANSELGRNAVYMKEAEDATDHCASSIDEFGKATEKATEFTQSYTEVIRNNLINTGVDAVKEMAGAAWNSVTELESAQKQLMASTGASAEKMNNYSKSIKDIYAGNYGDSLNDVAETYGKMMQYTKETNSGVLEEMTRNAMVLDDVFGMDITESIRGVDALMTNMGLTSEEAFDFIAKGAQNGLDKSGELADNISEYSQLWGQAGFSAREMFAILQNGLDSGAYNLDKVNDFVKEFTISLSDGRIDDNIGQFSQKTENMFYAWKNGEVSAKEVFNSVITDLSKMTNKQEALTIASEVWSALGEDNAMKVITSLNKVNTTYDNVVGTMDSINDIKYDTLESKWEELSRKFQMEIAEPMAKDFLPIAEDGLEMILENMDLIVPAITGIGTAAAGLKLASVFGIALNPITLVGGALAAGSVALMTYADNMGEVSKKVSDIAEASNRASESAGRVTESADKTISDYVGAMADIEAKKEYAQSLADRIETLAGKTKKSNAETAVMKEYIAQLNEMVPGLNLKYDDQAKSLNMTNREIENYIENSSKQIEVQAAAEYRTDLIRKQMDLEIEAIKLENEYKTAKEEREKITSGMSNTEIDELARTPQWAYALNGEETRNAKASYDVLTESIMQNTEESQKNKEMQEEAEREMAAVNKKLQELGIETENSTSAIERQSEALEENEAKMKAQEIQQERERQAQEQYSRCVEAATAEIVKSVQERINIFAEAGTLTGEEFEKAQQTTLENMVSQKAVMIEWAENMKIISDKGIEEGLLKTLAEAGPAGAEKVKEFAKMTDEEIRIANETWKETMKQAGIGAEIAGELTGDIDAIASDLYAKYLESAGSAVDGMVDGMKQGKGRLDEAGAESGETLVKGTRGKDGLDTGSPSKKMIAAGGDAALGLETGMLMKRMDVRRAGATVGMEVINGVKASIKIPSFHEIGQNASYSIAQGLLQGRRKVAEAAREIGNTVEQSVRKSLDMHSPSTVLVGLGELSAESYGIGFEDKMKYVKSVVNESMTFAPEQMNEGQSQITGESAAGVQDMVENALYNGMIAAMSRVKIENNLSGLNVNVTFGTDNLVEVLEASSDRFRDRTGKCIFSRG